MKAYTDLNQSKILAEILPLETADMKWYFWESEIDAPKFPTFGYSKDIAESYKDTEAVYLPCWSLAALLDILKDDIKIEKTLFDQSDMFTYSILGDAYVYRTYEHEDLIDACIEMLLKLNTKVNSL